MGCLECLGQFYSTPFYSRNDDVATRDFSNVVMNEQNPMSRSKGDYSLYCLGTFDGDSDYSLYLLGDFNADFDINVIVAEDKPVLVIAGSDL
jgi:hypothetical protein